MRKKYKMTGPHTTLSQEMHAEKYRGKGESFRESMNRVANALRDDEPHYHEFRDSLLDMRFMPGGRVQASMGSPKAVTPYNCFVSGTIEDSFVDGHGSIMERAKEAASTMRQGGGIGYDFSTLRPKGDHIRKLDSASSGPLPFMEIFDSVCRCVASSGHRRGAQMGVLRVDHPDIEAFIHAKQNTTALTGFNISIGITEEFMDCLATGRPFTLQFQGQPYSEVDAQNLWDMIMRSTWDWAEPGVLFIDTINRMNNLYYCETIAATNPCGEQPLPPYGACLLGSFNLTKYLNGTKDSGFSFDWDLLKHDIPHIVRAQDNIVDRAKYPLYEQEKEAKSKRRMGLGVCGAANTIEALGFAYGTPEYVQYQDDILQFINVQCYRASAELARDKGSFPLFDKEKYLRGQFVSQLDEETQWMIDKYGIRNSHLTSIAPTGTISLCADNVSSGIEPVFQHQYDRLIQTPEGPKTEQVRDYGYGVLDTKGKIADEVTPQEHVNVLCNAAQNVDSAVSKTCNIGPDVSWDEFKQVYIDAYNGGAKGCTTFRANGKRTGVLTSSSDEQPEEELACRVDPQTGRKECD